MRALTRGCRLGLLRCPLCGYHSLAREFQDLSKQETSEEATTTMVTMSTTKALQGKVSLGELPPGAEARLLGFDGLREPDMRRLLAYGLAPGVQVRLLQKSPAVVIKAGETELALEGELARSIEVAPQPRIRAKVQG